MQINETQEKEISQRLGITKPICPPDVAAFLADTENLRNGIDAYVRPSFSSWRTTTEETLASIAQAKANLTALEELADKVESHSDTVKLATTAYQEQLRTYWNAVETEENRPRRAFQKARDEFVVEMGREKRSLKRKQSKAYNEIYEHNNGTPERTEAQTRYNEITERLSLVEFMEDEARYLDYDAETAPAFTELVLWEKVARSESRADQFFQFVSQTKVLDF